MERSDESSAGQLQYSSSEHSLSASYMQSVNPYLTLGGTIVCIPMVIFSFSSGIGEFSLKNKAVVLGYGGIFKYGQHVCAAQWDNNV